MSAPPEGRQFLHIAVADNFHPAHHPRVSVCEHARMETMRESWTDERLDDLNHRVGEGFRRVDARFDRVDDRFDSLQRTLLQIGGGTIAALIAGFAAVVATQL